MHTTAVGSAGADDGGPAGHEHQRLGHPGRPRTVRARRVQRRHAGRGDADPGNDGDARGAAGRVCVPPGQPFQVGDHQGWRDRDVQDVYDGRAIQPALGAFDPPVLGDGARRHGHRPRYGTYSCFRRGCQGRIRPAGRGHAPDLYGPHSADVRISAPPAHARHGSPNATPRAPCQPTGQQAPAGGECLP